MRPIEGVVLAATTTIALFTPATAAAAAEGSPAATRQAATDYVYYATYKDRKLCEQVGASKVGFLWRDYYCKWTGGGTFYNLYVWWNAGSGRYNAVVLDPASASRSRSSVLVSGTGK